MKPDQPKSILPLIEIAEHKTDKLLMKIWLKGTETQDNIEFSSKQIKLIRSIIKNEKEIDEKIDGIKKLGQGNLEDGLATLEKIASLNKEQFLTLKNMIPKADDYEQTSNLVKLISSYCNENMNFSQAFDTYIKIPSLDNYSMYHSDKEANHSNEVNSQVCMVP